MVGTLEDRSELSNEMAELCAQLPIYIVAEGDLDPSDVDQTSDEAEDQTPHVEKLPEKREKNTYKNVWVHRTYRYRIL